MAGKHRTWVLLASQIWLLVILGWSAFVWWEKQQRLPACELTYMYPSFKKVDHPALKSSSKYQLYYFQDVTIEYDDNAPRMPVLFIPGNNGRYIQSRPLASETARQWHRQAGSRKVQLDWYAVDSLEELLAFDGAIVEHQVKFVVACIKYLREAYQNLRAEQQSYGKTSPTGMLLVGHSMGGLVARAAAARVGRLEAVGPGYIHLILTLGTPHQRPPLPTHPSLERFYARLAARTRQAGPPVISIDGGYNDTEVAGQLTRLDGVVPEGLGLHASTPTMPKVWASAHHASLVWCNQMVGSLASAINKFATEIHFTFGSTSGSAGSGSGKRGGKDLHLVRDQKEVALALFDKALIGRAWEAVHDCPATRSKIQATFGSKSLSPIQAVREAVGMVADLAIAAGSENCTGSNMVWYLQYLTPKRVRSRTFQLDLNTIKSRLKSTGLMYSWDLDTLLQRNGSSSSAGSGSSNSSSYSFALLVSGSKPCSAFRLWLHPRGEEEAAGGADATAAGADAGSSGSADAGSGSGSSEGEASEEELVSSVLKGAPPVEVTVDVTGLAVRLPAIMPGGRLPVRVWSQDHISMVIKGKDYDKVAGWLLQLPPSIVAQARALTLWLDDPSHRPAFRLVAQLSRHEDADSAQPLVSPSAKLVASEEEGQQQQDASAAPDGTQGSSSSSGSSSGSSRNASSSSSGTLRLHADSFTSATRLPPGSPMVQHIHVDLPASLAHPGFGIQNILALRIQQDPPPPKPQKQKQQADAADGSNPGSGKAKSGSGSKGTCFNPLVIYRDAHLQEHMVPNSTIVPLGPCLSYGLRPVHAESEAAAAATLVAVAECEAVAALDPACGYSVSLSTDYLGLVPQIILANVHAIWAFAHCLLLLALTRHGSSKAAAAAGTKSSSKNAKGKKTSKAVAAGGAGGSGGSSPAWLAGVLAAMPTLAELAVAVAVAAVAWAVAGCPSDPATASGGSHMRESPVCTTAGYVADAVLQLGLLLQPAARPGPRGARGAATATRKAVASAKWPPGLREAVDALLPRLPVQLPALLPPPDLDAVEILTLLPTALLLLVLLAAVAHLGARLTWVLVKGPMRLARCWQRQGRIGTAAQTSACVATATATAPPTADTDGHAKEASNATPTPKKGSGSSSSSKTLSAAAGGGKTLTPRRKQQPVAAAEGAEGTKATEQDKDDGGQLKSEEAKAAAAAKTAGAHGKRSAAASSSRATWWAEVSVAVAACYCVLALAAVAAQVGLGLLLAWAGLVYVAHARGSSGSSGSGAAVEEGHVKLHALMLYYGATAAMLLPSLVAWALQPAGHRQLSEIPDILLLLPPTFHCCGLLLRAVACGRAAVAVAAAGMDGSSKAAAPSDATATESADGSKSAGVANSSRRAAAADGSAAGDPRSSSGSGAVVSWVCRLSALILFVGTLHGRQFLAYYVQAAVGLAMLWLGSW